ncbi:MAG: VTT domain-containing protein [Deltaproteobacteria bacterium]|nr:VTT domain-containing protein [Deltaproteobacteria bacterium]
MDAPAKKRNDTVKLVLFLALGIVVMALSMFVITRYFSSWEKVNQTMDALTPWLNQSYGPFLFVTLTILCILIRGLAYVFIIIGGSVYPFWMAFLLCWAGFSIGTGLSFLISRFFLNDYFRPKLEKSFLKGFNKLLVQNGIMMMFILRAVLFFYRPINWMIGATGIGVRDYWIGNSLGLIPNVLLVLYVFRKFKTIESAAGILLPENILFLAGLIAFAVAVLVIRRKYFSVKTKN